MTDVAVSVLEPRFEPLVERLAQACGARAVGAQLAVFHRGHPVVDVAVGQGATTDVLRPVMSVSKGITGLCLARLVDRGLLDPDQPVSHYWPQFARRGKHAVTVEQALSHRAGLPAFEVDTAPLSWLEDDEAAAEHLAGQAPLWRPGAGFSYHPVTIGTIAGELCRRITGVGIQAYYEAEVRGPRGLAAYLGVPESQLERVQPVPMDEAYADPSDHGLGAVVARSLRGAHSLGFLANDPRSHRAGHPAAGGVASATGLASLYAAALWGDQGGQLFGPAARDRATCAVTTGRDLANGEHRTFGLLFQKPTRQRPFAGFAAFGHEGAGGAMAYADPAAQLALAYIPSRDVGEDTVDDASRTARSIAAGATAPTDPPPSPTSRGAR